MQLKVSSVSGVMAHLSKWKGLRWSSSRSSQIGMKACTPAGRPSIITQPQSTFKWRSWARTNCLVRTHHVVFSIYAQRAEFNMFNRESFAHINPLRYVIRFESSICGFNNCVYACVSALVAMIGTSSTSAIIFLLIVTLWLCWWVKCLHRWQVAARQVMCWRANEGNAVCAIQCETNRMLGSLTNSPKPHAVIHKQEAMWLKQTGASATAALFVDR